MFTRLSGRIAGILIVVMAVIMTVFTLCIIRKRSENIETELLSKGRLAVTSQARMVEQLLAAALRNGTLAEADLFADRYVPVAGGGRRFATSYDGYLGENLKRVADEYLKDDQVAYSLVADRNGYVAVASVRGAAGIAGTMATGEAELKAARSGEPFLRQVRRTDVGETVWDLAAPVIISGRHWGAVRLGISMAGTAEKIAELRVQIVGAMAMMLAVSSLTIFLVVSRSMRPLLRLTDTAKRIADGNLDEEVPVETGDEIGSLAAAFGRMTTVIVRTLRGEVEKSGRLFGSIREAIFQLSSSAGEMMAISAQQSSGAAEQASAVQQVTSTAGEIAITAKQITVNAGTVEKLAEKTSRSCIAGTGDVGNAIDGMERLRGQVRIIAARMLELGENGQRIGGIVEIIDEISDQTNLLALNAAIEAAGAGEAGKRFSVVAHEVRRLAERTAEATGQIRALIDEIRNGTNATVMVTEEGLKGVESAYLLVEKVRDSFGTIIGMVGETAEAAKEIAFSTRQQTEACEQMAETMNEVRDVAQQVAESARESEHAIAEMTDLTERLKDLMGDEIQSKGRVEARRGARLMERVLSEAVSSGRFTIDEIFDDNYIPIAGTCPQKFHTKYDTWFDETILEMEDAFLEDSQVGFAVLVDRNGYLPTHNSRYSRPITGDRAQDTTWNRTKRMFDDPVGIAAAHNTRDVLVQVYFRDTGEKMWDISAPVFVNGRHWGAFRIDYSI